jgi:rod shape-determining protein MreD
MRPPLLLLLTYLLLGLESPLLHQLNLSLYAPDLALIVVLWIAMNMSGTTGAVTAFLVGLLKDGFAMGSPVGMFTEIAVLVYFLFRFMAHKLTLRGVVPQMVVTLLGALVSGVFFVTLTAIFDRGFDSYGSILSMIVPQALITAPFAPLVFSLCGLADTLFSRRKKDSVFFS